MISLEDVVVSIGDLRVLDGVDLAVESGEFVALVGPNGAGKTTLLRTINGIYAPDSGTVAVDGTDVSDLSSKALSRRVATVPQDTHVGFAFTVEQIVEMGRTPHRSRLDWRDDTDPVDAALARTDTTQFRDRQIDELSGGERQRVLLARALAQDAQTLLLDEPTASLDINHQVRVLDILSDLVASGQTALAAIHDLDLAARYCDRLCLLHEGEIRAAGPPEAVLTGPTLDDAFETETAVAPDPTTGTPSVTAAPRRGERAQRVHVTGGGQTTARVVATLWRAGFDVSLGIVPAGDAAATIADRLGVESVTAPPFEHPGEETRRAATRLLAAADVVVRTDGPGTDPLESAIDRQERVVTVGGGEEHAVPARIDRAVAATLARQPSEADD